MSDQQLVNLKADLESRQYPFGVNFSIETDTAGERLKLSTGLDDSRNYRFVKGLLVVEDKHKDSRRIIYPEDYTNDQLYQDFVCYYRTRSLVERLRDTVGKYRHFTGQPELIFIRLKPCFVEVIIDKGNFEVTEYASFYDQSFVTISSRPVDDHSYYRILFWLMERDPELKSQISGDELTAEN